MNTLDIDDASSNDVTVYNAPHDASGRTGHAGEMNAAPSPRITFNDIAASPAPSQGLILAIRTDAGHATSLLKSSLLKHLNDAGNKDSCLPLRIEQATHAAYQVWGHTVLSAMADCLDYERYNLDRDDNRKIDVHFYNAQVLAKAATVKAQTLISPADADLPVVHITLDELIERQDAHWAEISFSRLFNLQGTQNGTYTARPGKKPLMEQIAEVRDLVDTMKTRYGRDIPVVLMEDNVRHAKMLNWVIDLLDRNGVFQNGKLAGVATCFSCASPQERAAIVHNGKIVPVAAVVDYGDAPVDVATPRDLLFDGFVVETDKKTARLPGIFMDIEKLFKIDSARVVQFHDAVMQANAAFCETIEEKFGVAPLLSWFQGADAIAHVTGHAMETPMTRIIRDLKLQTATEPNARALPLATFLPKTPDELRP